MCQTQITLCAVIVSVVQLITPTHASVSETEKALNCTTYFSNLNTTNNDHNDTNLITVYPLLAPTILVAKPVNGSEYRYDLMWESPCKEYMKNNSEFAIVYYVGCHFGKLSLN